MSSAANVPEPIGLLLCQDLFFTSKITGTASGLGLRVEVDGNRERALSKLGSASYCCVFLDLGWKQLAVADVMANLPSGQSPPVIAFGAHVDTGRLDEARIAGCAEVMPRSKLSATLPELLTRYVSR